MPIKMKQRAFITLKADIKGGIASRSTIPVPKAKIRTTFGLQCDLLTSKDDTTCKPVFIYKPFGEI